MSNLTKAMQIIGSNVRGDRQKDDYYSTPPHATEALLDVESFDGSIYEPCCGEGHIAKVLEEKGHDVESADLIDRGYGNVNQDFLFEQEKRDNIITNPPFKNALDFAKHSIWIADKKVALLLKIAFLEGAERKKFFEIYPPVRVWVFSKRLTLQKNGDATIKGGMICMAWFIWEKGYQGKPQIGWL